MDDRLPALVGIAQVKVQYHIADIIEKPDKKWFVIAKFRIQRGNILRLRRDPQDDRARIPRCQREDGKHKKCHSQKNRDHV